MKVEQLTWSGDAGWQGVSTVSPAQLVLVFGHRTPSEVIYTFKHALVQETAYRRTPTRLTPPFKLPPA